MKRTSKRDGKFVKSALDKMDGGGDVKLIVSNRAGIPIYEQIKAQIKDAIFSGELQEDDLLPSIRRLAKDLKISVITTTRAYNDLEDEGFIVRHPLYFIKNEIFNPDHASI